MRIKRGISVIPLFFYVYEHISMSPRVKVSAKSYILGTIHDQV